MCIAPDYQKYDLHAVQMMGANIELWRYRLYVDGSLSMEEIFKKSYSSVCDPGNKKPVVAKKPAIVRNNEIYTFEEHINGKPEKIKELALAVQEYTLGLDTAMEENPKKFYIAYKISQNIVCMEIRKSKILLYIKLNPNDFSPLPEIARDVGVTGHYGTGDLEITLKTSADFTVAKQFIEQAYNKVGG